MIKSDRCQMIEPLVDSDGANIKIGAWSIRKCLMLSQQLAGRIFSYEIIVRIDNNRFIATRNHRQPLLNK